MPRTILVETDPAAVAGRAAEMVIEAAGAAVAARGRFRIALAGGGTPGQLYRLLTSPSYRGRVPWSLTEVYWGDERHLPAGDPGRNDSDVLPLLADLGVPGNQIHLVPFIAGDVTKAAAAYEQVLRSQAMPGQPLLDLVLLGLGTDGHTASLFPGTVALDETERLVVPNYAAYEDRFPERVTLTFPAINACETAMFLVTGASKRDILHRVLGEPESPPLPAQRVQPASGRLFWLVDAAARS
ncbi:MAG: 6-phosphogluconolactonase [Anaerolineae bacterium]|nr:6-phosphogluconolactonase [Anaerolineae bacterium]MCB0204308.1 6-phosphogluconolactonase [Anaerolineae bacterium]MCB0252938.1 6-phosphogluconolactonase [Anaerolineae bacterium]